MMVPRSYMYASAPPRSEISQEKGFITKASKERGVPKESEKKSANSNQGLHPTLLSLSPATPSKPVVIPTRTKASAKKDVKAQKGKSEMRSSRSSVLHDPSSIPPANAALLAMTSIPEQGKRFATGSRPRPIDRTTTRRTKDHGIPKRSLSSTSPQTWDFLLTPPQEEEFESSSFASETTLGPVSSVRSISTESMPSLAEDEDSMSSMSNPASPGFAFDNRVEKRKQSLSTSVGEDCPLDHPLMTPAKMDVLVETEVGTPAQHRRAHPPGSKASFKSNLTASFRAIRSAARSISEFTGPLPQRDDLLSRSVLSINVPFTDERRPLPSLEPPDPALRRYLNPITLSPVEFYFHGEKEQTSCKASIQLQSYRPGARQSSNASSPPIFIAEGHEKGRPKLSKNSLDTEDALTSSLLPKQREPRENSDFLRVIVLEMNMRKVGKLSDSSPGRAKLWLPPREAGKKSLAGEALANKGKEVQEKNMVDAKVRRVPRRWAGEET